MKAKDFFPYLVKYVEEGNRPIVCHLIVDDDWSTIRITPDIQTGRYKAGHLVAKVSTYLHNQWTDMGTFIIAAANWSLDSPVHNPVGDLYYKHQLLILFDALFNKQVYNVHRIFVEPMTYCKVCGRRLNTYASILRGYGPECRLKTK